MSEKSPPRRKKPVKTRAQLQDDSIMGTNNSSIVSKRSVERLYYPNEVHYFRHFVKKPQRRAPLINRGYWLRMKCIDEVCRQFLESPLEKRRILINLGCGYDPLPWQCLHRYPTASKNVLFVDVDYKDLMIKKRSSVTLNKELSSMFTNCETSEDDILFRSDQYVQVACDLRDLHGLQRCISKAFDLGNSSILFVAEVSITYMDMASADALIKWASELPEAQFCLLEQLLPAGIDHPFAQTMMNHFNNLQTPLGSVQSYPKTSDQHSRFRNLGWSSVVARSLWELWSDEGFLRPHERKALDSIEPFDEWEEFALFCCHYVLVISSTGRRSDAVSENTKNTDNNTASLINNHRHNVAFSEYPKDKGKQRFASAFPLRSKVDNQELYGVFAGMGVTTRINTVDIYSNGPEPYFHSSASSPLYPSARMCHTMTDLGEFGALLVGGRASPDHGLLDCWLYHKWVNIWERVSDLPEPRYRHQSINLGHGYLLASPGRIDSHTISTDFLLWNRTMGWVACEVKGTSPRASYGGVLLVDYDRELNNKTGIFVGGISVDGVLVEEIWRWTIPCLDNKHPIIVFEGIANVDALLPITRFGASVVTIHGVNYIAGGIVRDKILQIHEEVCCVQKVAGDYIVSSIALNNLNCPRPLLIGTTLFAGGHSLIIAGGSATCFSFGTFWNKGCYTLSFAKDHEIPENGDALEEPSSWRYQQTLAPLPSMNGTRDLCLAANRMNDTLTHIPRVSIKSSEDFRHLVHAGKPVIIEGLDIGACTSNWTASYLKTQVGDRDVVVHESSLEVMDFVTKNFSYKTMKFGDFIDQIASGGRLYLRSLSADKPSELPTNFVLDFPSIARDFRIPPELEMVNDNMHSSPLRISGNVSMWLHFDSLANILCQVQSAKRLLLFPPSDVKHFGFEPGSSSSSADVFNKLKEYPSSHPHEAILQPGDILYLPPLWLHAASPLSGLSISINVFFRNLRNGYSAGRDVYGNRDLQAYEKGRQDIQRIVRSFDGLPVDIREFYLQRLVDEFEVKTRFS